MHTKSTGKFLKSVFSWVPAEIRRKGNTKKELVSGNSINNGKKEIAGWRVE